MIKETSWIPNYLEGITCKEYENLNKDFDELAWPETEEEYKRYVERVYNHYKDIIWWPGYDPMYKEMSEKERMIDDKKSHEYFNLDVELNDMGRPRNLKEATLFVHRASMECSEPTLIKERYKNAKRIF